LSLAQPSPLERMPPFKIQYRFRLEEGQEERFDLELDSRTLVADIDRCGDLPPWTRLDFNQCPNCPLEADQIERCPAAVNMVSIVNRFTDLLSYDRTLVEVETADRKVFAQKTVQHGICSLMGLLMATSGCPRTDFFKPMARFHLPFASTDETIWRATSTYLLSQYFLKQDGGHPDVLFQQLSKIYNAIQTVNLAFAKRLRAACNYDSMINAIILLDMFAKSMPTAIDESLEQIRHIFKPYLSHIES
jgi:hypothetical protein